ncbi:hypothetical protein H4J38_01685 [Colwellia sp. BRX10-3]|jgi:hypothetical protein|nr:hypothetical protein [Colwellia sp. BRX10-3]MBA6389484.1 hypothetical protein [Colwellia sp. BRX10-3]
MNKSSSSGIKLTTVILAVLILAISALLSSGSAADDKDVVVEKINTELVN